MREDIFETKKNKLERLTQAFHSVYPEHTDRSAQISEVLARFDENVQSEKVCVLAGRIRSLRDMGKIAFGHLEDGTGKIQFFLSEKNLGMEKLKLFTENIELGDFVEVRGKLFLTKQNEKTLEAFDWKILSKALRTIPAEFYGMKNEEDLLRKRYLDLLLNPETRELFRKKNLFWQTIRQFFVKESFLEVQTPVLEHVPGGADAEPFLTHHNALNEDYYLRISLELHLKRLLVGGYERIFEIGRLFRNEGIDREHLQEYDDIEFYAAYMDFEQGINLLERLFKEIVRTVVGEGMKTEYEGETIDWSRPFARINYFEAFKKETDIDLSSEVTLEALQQKAEELGIKYDPAYGKGRMIDTIYKRTVRQKLVQPCFLVGHPLEISPLSKLDPRNPKATLRVQPIAGRSELGNGFSELNDPLDQRKRFEEQMKLREAGDKEAHMIDEDFLEALEYGMPPAFGFGMSERLFALLMNRSVRETVIFPPIRKKEEGN